MHVEGREVKMVWVWRGVAWGEMDVEGRGEDGDGCEGEWRGGRWMWRGEVRMVMGAKGRGGRRW